MGTVWTRYGGSTGGSAGGEDWARALGHELGHYTLFLDDLAITPIQPRSFRLRDEATASARQPT